MVGLIIIVITVLTSYKGLKDLSFFNTYSFQVEKILAFKECKRLFTSGFLHGSWTHLLFNMISLYAFSGSLEAHIGPIKFLLIYVAALIGGNLFALYIHRLEGSYTAIGASGAVCGIIFSAIALFPGMEVGFIILPVSIPGWLYGFLYVLITIYGIKSRTDNIGHDAHFGGALIGLLITIALYPNTILYNYIPIILIAIPSVYFIYMLIRHPHGLITGSFSAKERFLSREDQYNATKKEKQKELDRLLEKIHTQGISSLTPQERERLDKLAGRN